MMIIGVDPHKSTDTATAVDPRTNRAVASVRIEASLADYRRLLRWAGQFDRRRWAIENAEGLGRHLSSCCWLAVRTWSTFGQPRPPEALLPTSRQQQLLLFCVRFVHPAMPSGSASRSPPAWSDQRTPRSFGEHPDQHRRHRRDHRRSSDRANRSGGPVPHRGRVRQLRRSGARRGSQRRQGSTPPLTKRRPPTQRRPAHRRHHPDPNTRQPRPHLLQRQTRRE
jgi:hypothetical protein